MKKWKGYDYVGRKRRKRNERERGGGDSCDRKKKSDVREENEMMKKRASERKDWRTREKEDCIYVSEMRRVKKNGKDSG